MSGGVATAAEQAIAALGDALPSAEDLVQQGLFDDLDVAETGALGAPSPLSTAHPLAGALGKRKAGRPPGSPNRRTERTVQWFLSQNRHPLAVMAEAYSMSPPQLARAIGLPLPKRQVKHEGAPSTWVEEDGYDTATLLEIFKLQLRMAEACAPYVAQRLPQAVELSGGADFTLTFGGVSFPAPGRVADGQPVVEGQAMRVVLPSSRTMEVGPGENVNENKD